MATSETLTKQLEGWSSLNLFIFTGTEAVVATAAAAAVDLIGPRVRRARYSRCGVDFGTRASANIGPDTQLYHQTDGHTDGWLAGWLKNIGGRAGDIL